MRSPDFYLVQRMVRNFRDPSSLLDPIVSISQLAPDYMGSANFEFGALPRALKAMKETRLSLTKIVIRAYHRDITLHVVAPIDLLPTLEEEFQAWANRNFRSHEEPNLRAAITRKDWADHTIEDERYARYYPLAWWSLNDKLFWSLEENIAKLWLADITSATTNAPVG